jgi:Fungal Zn(2)-Cys(6) binuclear cluster domain
MIPSAQWSGQEPSAATRSDTPADRASNMQPNAPNPRPNLQSCQFCRKRKIKCDKLEGGCSQCSRAQTECVYPASQRKGRPRKAGTNRSSPPPTPREAQLLKKIWKLERAVASMAEGNAPLVGEGAVASMVREL